MKKTNKSIAFKNAAILELKKMRDALGKTQDEVFDETKIHIGRIESQKRDIRLTTVYRLCEYYKASVPEFFNKVIAQM
jgi:transcriptional regulator with XRE-family HTH domain